MSKIAVMLILITCSAPALAVYKCESGGKTTYSDKSCTQGKVTQLSDEPAVEKADITRADRENIERKKRIAALEKTRHQREAVEEKKQQRAAKSAAAQRKRCTTLSLRKKWSAEDASRAAGKAVEKARLKARRAEEQYDAECKGF